MKKPELISGRFKSALQGENSAIFAPYPSIEIINSINSIGYLNYKGLEALPFLPPNREAKS